MDYSSTVVVGAEIPAGGTVGQVLAKVSGTDLDIHWVDPAGGGGGSSLPGLGYAAAVLSESPLAFWDDYTGLDRSGNNRPLTMMNQPRQGVISPLTGKMLVVYGYLGASGSSSTVPFAQAPDAPWLDFTSVTAEFLIYYAPSGYDQCPVSRQISAFSSLQFSIPASGLTTIAYWVGGTMYTLADTVALARGAHHLAFTYDGTTGVATFYADGVARVTQTHIGGLNTGTARLTVGAGDGGTSGGTMYSPMYSIIEGIAIHATALSITRILAHATAGGVV